MMNERKPEQPAPLPPGVPELTVDDVLGKRPAESVWFTDLRWAYALGAQRARAAYAAAQSAPSEPAQWEREAFEAAYTLKLLTIKDAQRTFRRLSHTPDEYEVASVHAAWVMWQYARAALASRPAVPLQLETAEEARKDREHAEAYYRQAERLLTANEKTLHEEVERLRAALAQQPAARVALTDEQIVALRKDAERYRFIRDADRSECISHELGIYAMESLDEYVDAAMEGEAEFCRVNGITAPAAQEKP